MKKIIALALALVMVLGCVSAFALDNDTYYTKDDRNMTNRVSVDNVQPNFLVTTESSVFEDAAMEAKQKTDVWLQVEASGQIDITVPLVAIFKTNIDGGRETISENYKLINYSSAAIAVTKMEIKDYQANVQTNNSDADKNMQLVAMDELEGKYNKYALIVKPDDQYNIQKKGTDVKKQWQEAQDVADDESHQKSPLPSTMFTNDGAGNFTLDSKSNATNELPGLWLVERNPVGSTAGNSSYMQLTLETSKLTFVTKQDTVQKSAANIENGVKLFTITYYVKIDNASAVGEAIHGDTTGTDYNTASPAEPEVVSYHYNGIITNPDA